MRTTRWLALMVVLAMVALGSGRAWADDEDAPVAEPAASDEAAATEPPAAAAAGSDDEPDEAPPAAGAGDATDDGTPAAPAPAAADPDGDGRSAAAAQVPTADVDLGATDSDGDGTPDAQEDGDIDNDGVADAQEADPPTDPFDADGDGVLEADEAADREEFAEIFDDIPNAPDDAALDARAEDAELVPSMTVDDFRKAVAVVKKIVLGKMSTKIANKADRRMATFSWIVFGVSTLGLLLLLMPLALANKYPGKRAMLFKYSAMAAATFFITVNLFGAVLFGLRTAQGALASYTNPSIAIAEGTFATLHDHAEDYVVMGKELFAPTLEQMRDHPDQQPSVLLLENGMKIVEDARVFRSMARMFEKVDFLCSILPILLTLVTLVLFVLAIKPTLVAIVKLPAAVADGNTNAGREVIATSVRRVKGELLATLGTVGVLAVLTLVSSFVLGKVVGPALDALLGYFSVSVQYLQFVEGASSGMVFVTLFGVVLFLVLELAALILSMSFFLKTSQQIFQQRFHEGAPIANHARFFKWGVPAVLLVQLFPLGFVYAAGFCLEQINDSLLANVTDAESVPWQQLLFAGPAFLVVGFAVTFWAVRGVAAIKFLRGYKPKAKA